MTYILLLITISTILSYLILKCIYRIIFKSKKRISKFLVFLGSIGLIIFYYTPYSFYLEPSYWQFRNMCKLNELPNNEEKYNKILSYFGLNLDSLDWEELNKKAEELNNNSGYYKKNVFEYRAEVNWKTKGRTEMLANLFSNKLKIDKYNVNAMYFSVVWHSKRYFLERYGTSYNLMWTEGIIGCSDIVKKKYDTKRSK